MYVSKEMLAAQLDAYPPPLELLVLGKTSKPMVWGGALRTTLAGGCGETLLFFYSILLFANRK